MALDFFWDKEISAVPTFQQDLINNNNLEKTLSLKGTN